MLKAAEGRKLLKTDYLILEDYTLECSEKVWMLYTYWHILSSFISKCMVHDT
jgi:hypothetical protein